MSAKVLPRSISDFGKYKGVLKEKNPFGLITTDPLVLGLARLRYKISKTTEMLMAAELTKSKTIRRRIPELEARLKRLKDQEARFLAMVEASVADTTVSDLREQQSLSISGFGADREKKMR